MKIPIIDNIVMTSDAHNIILNREVIPKEGKYKGKKQLKAYAYHPTVTEALEGLVNQKMKESVPPEPLKASYTATTNSVSISGACLRVN